MEQKLRFGEVVEGTVEVLQRNWQPVFVYVGVLTAVGALLEWASLAFADGVPALSGGFEWVPVMLGIGAGIAGIAIFFLAVAAQYLLWEALLRREGLGEHFARHRYLAFFGQMILVSIGTSFGYVLLLIPGLIFAARWSMAPAFLVGNDQGLIEAMSNSWDAVRGNTTPIALTYLVGIVAVLVVAGGAEAATAWDAGGTVFNLVSIALSQFASQIGVALAIALGVFLFRRLHGAQVGVSEVFA